jgi:hypothetical protein
MMNVNIGNDKDNKKSCYSDSHYYFIIIKTETGSWIIRPCDIRSDGSIPEAISLSSPRARAFKIRRFQKEEA